ncbi:MAG: BT_3928 family protein [Bacteroidota bacterium]
MKLIVNIARIIVGGLFVFSGLVKAIDPLGLSYKMQEFFEVWAADNYLPSLMNWLHGHSYLFSVIMITLEVVVGVALLIGWKKKLTLSILLLLILFFTFLTSYVLFSGKIRACGCFGDCIPLTPIQTFTKDIILLLLVLLLLVKQKYILPLFSNVVSSVIILIALAGTVYLQMYVAKHLPIKDCLPYKAGNDILKLREMPDGAIPDKFEYLFTYKKGGQQKDFTTDQLPDSTWEFVDRKQTLVQKGVNNIPLINDFSLTDSTGADVTETILSQEGTYYLLFIKDMDSYAYSDNDIKLIEHARSKKIPLYIVTSQATNIKAYFDSKNISKITSLEILTADATAIKTAARVNSTLFVMKGPVVQLKLSYADFDKILIK